MRRIMIILGCLAVFRMSVAAAERVTLDKPVKVSAQTTDKTRLAGRATAYDDDGFDLTDAKGKSSTIAWKQLDPHTVYEVWSSLLARKDGEGFMRLAVALMRMEKGKTWADHALDRAVKIDPSLRARVADLRKNGPPPMEAQPGDSTTPVPGKTEDPANKAFWGKQTEAERATSINELKEFAEKAAKTISSPVHLYETKYFLFYSDLNQTEAMRWASLLDRMYGRLAEMFGIAPGENLWRGKAVIFVFSAESGYGKYERQVEHVDPTGTAGLCHMRGDGTVHIAFYRQPDELEFAHVLVHESTHGFLFRYRSSVFIASWMNEGLAETIAGQLVPQSGRDSMVRERARNGLMEHKNDLGGFFTGDHIAGWQYPVAESITVFMIREGKTNYVNFINGIKDGMSWEESLAKNYKAPLSRLVPAFGAYMGLNKPLPVPPDAASAADK